MRPIIGKLAISFILVVGAAMGATGVPFAEQQIASATTSWTYCSSIPKYACGRFIYTANGNNFTMLERNWKGSRGCVWDQFGQWTCGAERWQMTSGVDRYVPAGGGGWVNGYGFGPYAWEYNDTLGDIPWRVSAPDQNYWADTIGTFHYLLYYTDGYYWNQTVYAYA